MKTKLFRKVLIIGMGFMGGSVGIAIRKRKIADRVSGLSRSKESIKKAIEKGVIDDGDTVIKARSGDSDLVIVAVPVGIIGQIIEKISPILKKGCLITDIGSVKKGVVSEVDRILPSGSFFVGSHPLAGAEKSGIDWAQDSLLDKATCIITPGKRSSASSIKLISQLWKALGMKVLIMSPEEHDFIVALTSHLPHLASAGLVSLLNDFKQKNPAVLSGIASGFTDTTRIASSSPELWHDIFIKNKMQLLPVLTMYRKTLGEAEQLIRDNDSKALIRFLEKAKKLRDEINKS